jgi:polar amino acid transport system substrate-binding protein
MSKASLPVADVAKWRALVESMRTDGTMLRIFGKYFKPELAKSMVNF